MFSASELIMRSKVSEQLGGEDFRTGVMCYNRYATSPIVREGHCICLGCKGDVNLGYSRGEIICEKFQW